MKDPWKLQEKLRELLRGHSDLRILIPSHPWDPWEMTEIAWTVEAYVNDRNDVIECDPLKDWIEEYKFFVADKRN